MNLTINTMYFSATDTTKKVVSSLAERISKNMHNEAKVNYIDFTLPEARECSKCFDVNNIVIIGVPVYAGRVPNVLLKYLNSIKGNGALAIAIVVYGNRDYDDALIELKDILESNGFRIVAGGAFIGEHAFSYDIAKGRPDDYDIAVVQRFADEIALKLMNPISNEKLFVSGHKPYRPYYMPKNRNNQPVDIRKVTPKTNGDCVECKLCAAVCPMGSIDFDDVSKLNDICIKCGACIKKCPQKAKFFDDSDYLKHKLELEHDFAERCEPEFFLLRS